MAEIRFEHVYKRFGETVAVKDLNLVIPDKEFLVLVGHFRLRQIHCITASGRAGRVGGRQHIHR